MADTTVTDQNNKSTTSNNDNNSENIDSLLDALEKKYETGTWVSLFNYSPSSEIATGSSQQQVLQKTEEYLRLYRMVTPERMIVVCIGERNGLPLGEIS